MRRTFLKLSLLALSVLTTACTATTTSGTLTREELFDKLSTAGGFASSTPPTNRVAYVFFDPQCPHCAHLWEQAKPLARQIKIVWLPVGILRANSAPQGAAILGAADPVAAMNVHEASLTAQKGGITVLGVNTSATLPKVEANTKLLKEFKAEGVPYIVVRPDPKGKVRSAAAALDTHALADLLEVSIR